MSTKKITDKYANSLLSENDTQCPLWRFVTKLDKASGSGGNINFKCNYCGDTFKGSYSRVKSHLLKLHGNFKLVNQAQEDWNKKNTINMQFVNKLHE